MMGVRMEILFNIDNPSDLRSRKDVIVGMLSSLIESMEEEDIEEWENGNHASFGGEQQLNGISMIFDVRG